MTEMVINLAAERYARRKGRSDPRATAVPGSVVNRRPLQRSFESDVMGFVRQRPVTKAEFEEAHRLADELEDSPEMSALAHGVLVNAQQQIGTALEVVEASIRGMPYSVLEELQGGLMIIEESRGLTLELDALATLVANEVNARMVCGDDPDGGAA